MTSPRINHNSATKTNLAVSKSITLSLLFSFQHPGAHGARGQPAEKFRRVFSLIRELEIARTERSARENAQLMDLTKKLLATVNSAHRPMLERGNCLDYMIDKKYSL